MKEFKNGESVQIKGGENWHCRVYIGTHQDRHVVGNLLGGVDKILDDRIRKELPNFMDVEIDWLEITAGGGFFPNCIAPWGRSGENISVSPVGQVHQGWALSGYLIDGHDEVYREPILFNTNGTEIESKATHARFVKTN